MNVQFIYQFTPSRLWPSGIIPTRNCLKIERFRIERRRDSGGVGTQQRSELLRGGKMVPFDLQNASKYWT
jgi:hypothetical protein